MNELLQQTYWSFSFPVAQQTNSGTGGFNAEVSRSHTHTHTHTHTHSVGLPRTSDQTVAKAATYTTHNKLNIGTSKPSARFEHVIAAIKQPQTTP